MLTYRDERRLIALLAIIILSAAVALMQITAARNGTTSPIAVAGSTIFAGIENVIGITTSWVRTTTGTVLDLPNLARDNATLRARNGALAQENARLNEVVHAYRADAALQPLIERYPRAIEARAIGFPPENESRTITIDRGANAGIHKDDGVISNGGVVGRVAQVGPFTSTVVLITDYTSRIPAVVRRGRWWGIARGNLGSVRMEYISQDAPVRAGDMVVTGEGRSFHAGELIGTIVSTERSAASLFQTAVVKTAVELGAVDRVLVVPK